ncbi:helix-turn-helix domain-containing protein [Bradyrhizobium elkanii]|uniref:helix-turn-helix domain-containing protein n=1 Tax=Bradyrhizobium elkanii TaxID=29448 RepID=UPI001FD8C86D|nr:helix-turn-helix domain-containing protein [Bradyrhizobium elkanii]
MVLTTRFTAFERRPITGFDQLSQAIVGTRAEIVQIEPGKLRGEVLHAEIAGLPINVATFNLGLRSKGGSNKERITIGVLAESAGRVTRAFYESRPGDVLVTPPGSEYENRYYGGASILTVMPSAAELEFALGCDARLGAPSRWARSHFKANSGTVHLIIPRLRLLLARLDAGDLTLTAHAAEFWRRAIIEALTASIMEREPAERDGPLPSALKTVRQVEDYLAAQDEGPIHISHICNRLRISRRSLHRAFHEALGIGPISYLRCQRLCAVHAALRSSPPDKATIGDIAIQHGFLNVGRFAQYYRELFGELPSETRRGDGDDRRRWSQPPLDMLSA